MSFKLNKELKDGFAVGRCHYLCCRRIPAFLLTTDFPQSKNSWRPFAYVQQLWLCSPMFPSTFPVFGDRCQSPRAAAGVSSLTALFLRSGLRVLLSVACVWRRLYVAFEAMPAHGRRAYFKQLLLMPPVCVSRIWVQLG